MNTEITEVPKHFYVPNHLNRKRKPLKNHFVKEMDSVYDDSPLIVYRNYSRKYGWRYHVDYKGSLLCMLNLMKEKGRERV
jgi:hypothetical protein